MFLEVLDDVGPIYRAASLHASDDDDTNILILSLGRAKIIKEHLWLI
jgi:hypothetical protein